MKQTRKTNGRTLPSRATVTSGFVEEGVIMGTPFASAMGAMASERDDATSPRSTAIRSCTMRRVAATEASSGLP